MTGLPLELRSALRQLRKSPGFAATTVLTLTLAIGVATAVFSVLYAVLLRPLPYAQPERIVQLQSFSPQNYSQPASYPEYLAWREGNQSFQALAGVQPYSTISLEGPAAAVALNKVEASDNFFTIFGVNPILGRTFLPGEDQPGKNDLVVLSHEVWQEEFGGRHDVVGQTAKMDGRPYLVIGVMPAGFRYPLGTRKAVYVPFHVPPAWITQNGMHWMQTAARLKPGITLEQAQADMDRVMNVLTKAGRVPPGRRIRLQELSASATGGLVAPFRVLVLAVMAVLAIGCTNVAGLLLARGVKREHEIGIRVSLGASKWRVMRQLLSETLLLCIAGATGGVLLALGLLHSTRVLLINAFARGVDVRIDKAELLAALGLAFLCALISGLLPAWRISGVEPNRALKASGGAGSSRSQQRLRASFVVVQVGIAFSLLIASGLMLRSLSRSLRTDLGFSTDRLLTVDVSPSRSSYEKRDIVTSLYHPLSEKVRTIPGVREVGLVSMLPIRQVGSNADVHIVGHPPAPPNQEQLAELRFVTPGYFSALGLAVKRGRMLNEQLDRPDSKVTGVIVNDAFVRRFLSEGEEPIGKRIEGFAPNAEIVGVVRSVRQDLYEQPLAEMDILISQVPPADRPGWLPSLSMVIRTNTEPEAIIPSLRQAFHGVDSGLPLGIPRTMPEVISDTLVSQRFQNWVFGTFAALALVLAIVGLYGLISQEILLSTRDIGVRMALGASRGKTFAAIYRRICLLLGSGLSVGLLITLLLKKVLATVVLISPGKDSGVILGLAACLFGAGLLATFFPAMRASKVDLMIALRCE